MIDLGKMITINDQTEILMEPHFKNFFRFYR
ncbi:MAG: hypothetical protein N838_00240 [Thiohalocapsa sp. PB-PSB1]|nr:MAG: hypothetical protein N838_00240 [Thiohalocapsa sp. PB-PSB1]